MTPVVKKEEPKKAPKARYKETVGRRKTAVARVRLFGGKGAVTINEKKIEAYFTLPRLRIAALAPLQKLGLADKYDITVHVNGGGIHAQAGAIRHGIARALVEVDAEFKKQLRSLGFMTRDSRMVERKKYGLKKARKSPQWAKR